MGIFLYTLLMMSISGSIMFIAAELLYRRTGGKSAGWYYAMLITSAALFLIPLGSIFSIPKLCMVTVPEHTGFTAVNAVPSQGNTARHDGISLDIFSMLSAVYACAAGAMLIKLAYEYLHTRKRLLMASTPSFDPHLSAVCSHICVLTGIRRRVRIRTSPCIRSPLLFGIISPCIILPEKQFTDEDLSMIVRHELTHLRHMDILIKLCASVVCALHWFNPLSYKLKKAIGNACELCCDESILKDADRSYKKAYGMLLISVIEHSEKAVISSTTAMACPTESVKHRLIKILEFKRMSLPVRIITAMTAMSIAACSLTVLGFETAATAMPENVRDTILPGGKIPESGDTGGSPGIIAEFPDNIVQPSAAPPSENAAAATAEPSEQPYTAETALPQIYGNDTESLSQAPEQDVQTFDEGVNIPAADTRTDTYADTYWDNGAVFSEAYTEPFTPSLPENSYVFNYNFADTGLSDMENHFSASENCVACIYRNADYTDDGYPRLADIAVYDNSDGGRLIYESANTKDRYSSNIFIRLKRGHEYSVRAFNSSRNENIYVYAVSENEATVLDYYTVYE